MEGWEEIVKGTLYRIEVPGGWIYRTTTLGGMGYSANVHMVFVPKRQYR